jgi:hypothetical protein
MHDPRFFEALDPTHSDRVCRAYAEAVRQDQPTALLLQYATIEYARLLCAQGVALDAAIERVIAVAAECGRRLRGAPAESKAREVATAYMIRWCVEEYVRPTPPARDVG